MEFNDLDKFIRNDVLRCSFLDSRYKVHILEKGKSIPDCVGRKVDLGENLCTLGTELTEYIGDLRKWSVFRRNGKIAIRGTLTYQKNEVKEEYDAGIVLNCLKKNWINTEKGNYHLIGPPERRNKINIKLFDYWYVTEEFPKELINY